MPPDDNGTALEKDSYAKDEVAKLIEARNAALEANRNELLTEAKKLRSKLATFEGIDPEQVRTMLKDHEQIQAERERVEREKAEAAGNWKSLQDQLEKKHAVALDRLKAEKDGVLAHLQRTLVDNAAVLELAKHSDTPNLLLPHVIRQMKVIEEEGEYVARIVDPRGNVRISKAGRGTEPMTLPELMDEMKQDKQYAPAFRGSGSSGGGAPRSAPGGSGPKQIAADDGSAFLRDLKGISDGTVAVSRVPTT